MSDFVSVALPCFVVHEGFTRITALITCLGDIIQLYVPLWHHCTVVVILHAIPSLIVLIFSIHDLLFLSSSFVIIPILVIFGYCIVHGQTFPMCRALQRDRNLLIMGLSNHTSYRKPGLVGSLRVTSIKPTKVLPNHERNGHTEMSCSSALRNKKIISIRSTNVLLIGQILSHRQ
jgi:hypothetical protein